MINRLRGLFQRYAQSHRHIEAGGFGLTSGSEPLQGYVDRVVLNGTRVTFFGWSTADRILLSGADGQSVTRPDIPRQDVADAIGVSPRVGFEITQGYGNGQFSLIVETGGVQHRHDIAPISPARVRRDRRQLALRFLWTVLRVSPQIIRAMRHDDPAARAAVKSALGLNAVAEAGPMETRIFVKPDDAAVTPDPVPVTLILPVYNAFDLLPEVLQRVVDHTDLPWRMIVIEDGSSDTQVRPWLTDWVAAHEAQHPGQVELILNETNMGFIRSVNAGLTRAAEIGDHVILLNSDAFVPQGWASRLIRPMLVHEGVASTTPMSNDAEIFSVPAICQRMPLEPGQGDTIDRVAQQFHPEALLTVTPTGVGFCMGMNPDYLKQVPQLDTVFGRGYGEEVDWCQKVRALGGRHLGVPGLFVEHRGGTSFGSEEKLKLVAKNNEMIATRYPGYDMEVQQFLGADPMVTARLALAIAWAVSRHDGPLPIYMAHALGGGADKYLERRIRDDLKATGRPAIVLRVGSSTGRWQVELVSDHGTTAGMTDDFSFVERLLDPVTQRHIVYSCGVGDPNPVELPDHLLQLKRDGDTVEVLVHDFFMLSPSYTLLDEDGVYRGPVENGRTNKAHQASAPGGNRITLQDWRAAWGGLLKVADEIVVFCQDSRTQVLTAYPEVEAQIVLRPHALLGEVPKITRPEGGPRVIAVLGNIGYQKGASVVAELGRRLEAVADVKLVLIGNVDPAYLPPASVPVHGNYLLEDLPGLAARYGITDWLVPSIWPETFSYTTHEALATGLPVYAFDIGAQGDAVARAENGHVIAFRPESDLAQILFDRFQE